VHILLIPLVIMALTLVGVTTGVDYDVKHEVKVDNISR